MKTLKKVPITYKIIDGFMPPWSDMEDGVIYISEKFNTAHHRCLCGCGQPTVTPLGPGQWNIEYSPKGLSMKPSISNYQFACKSHYIITNGVANFV